MCYSSLPGGDLIVPEATIYPLVLMDVPSQGSNLMDVIIHRLPNAKGSSVEGFSINLIFFFFAHNQISPALGVVFWLHACASLLLPLRATTSETLQEARVMYGCNELMLF